MTTSRLVKKLLIRPGHRMAVLNPPPGFLQSLSPLPNGAAILRQPHGSLDFVHLFVRDRAELEKHGPSALLLLKPDGVFWISYPKQTSNTKTDLNRDILWKLMEKYAFLGVAMVAIDHTWSAMRFRPAAKVGGNKK